MTADANVVRIRPGTLEDNHACTAVLVDAINDLGRRNGSIDDASALDLDAEWPRWRPFFDHIARTAAEFWVAEGADGAPIGAVMSHAERRRHELGAAEAFFEVALHNRIAIDPLLGRGYRMDAFMTLICSSEPFGQFERYLFCAPGLIL